MLIKNVVEDHVAASYDVMRAHYPDFCGCDICRGDVLVYALNRIPARYVGTLEGSVVTEFILDKDQSRASIDVTLMDGFRKIARAPRCGKKPGSSA
ncbi:MAG: late competence development ComFB family protein [Gemmatimonadales bacterium]|nr:late competence development ComFB family protein [Gemmatimonadales bacterium]